MQMYVTSRRKRQTPQSVCYIFLLSFNSLKNAKDLKFLYFVIQWRVSVGT